ncbi:Rrf2 family transcriptional regulator [Acetatifactor muris]|uniref:HTH-type transcriptional regulator CymR n=1 Tax=Acetatifactor muris TaxID=879566 RepID=A0A2K4ZFU7_9FIRM|nr:Rrf2 family transcriptional regulator [Acetatifactor muris]MCR2047670.1 Rrf2 family transcriptional regulator [Acetatifactor muris]SOY29322.1 HTH-type transcriptional regulator CymR [Acetatifactor muris]
MMISTKGRYALRVMIDLAENFGKGYVPMKEVAERQNISLKYLERILPVLTRNKLIEGVQGRGGGYRLTADPGRYRVGDILRLTEGDLAPVACLGCDADACERAADCKTLPMWSEFHRLTNAYFDGILLSDFVKSLESNHTNS